MKSLKILSVILLGLLLLIGTILYTCNAIIKSQSEAYISYDIHQLPPQKVGLLLGTSKTLKNGYKNYYFYNRIDAAEALYKSKKIQYLIVSGDNSRKNYNEPEDMKLELIARGIPTDRIFEDFAGFRTLDSVVRAKEIFGQKQFIVISQKFHNERAIFGATTSFKASSADVFSEISCGSFRLSFDGLQVAPYPITNSIRLGSWQHFLRVLFLMWMP